MKADMKKMAHLARFAESIAHCSLCGQCDAVCPVLARTGAETDGPRGRLFLLRQWLNGQISGEDIARSMERCLLCGKCGPACPAALPLPEIFLAGRLDLQILHSLGRDLELLITGMPAPLQNVLQYPAAKILEFLREIPSLKNKLPPLGISEKRPSPPKGDGKAQVLLFTGCLARRVFPEVGSACVKLLEASGHNVNMPRNLSCCAMPHLRNGLGAQALRLIKRNLRLLAKTDFEILLSPCPECLGAIKKIWPSLPELSEDERRLAGDIAAKTRDIHTFLAESLQPAASRETCFWHQPCHMEEEAAKAARHLCAADDWPVSHMDACCGAPFGYRASPMKNRPQKQDYGAIRLGQEIATDTASEILACGASSVITACPHCVARLRNTFKGMGFSVPVLHTIQWLADNAKKNEASEFK